MTTRRRAALVCLELVCWKTNLLTEGHSKEAFNGYFKNYIKRQQDNLGELKENFIANFVQF